MNYTHNIEGCLESKVGNLGISPADITMNNKKIFRIFNDFKEEYQEGKFPMLDILKEEIKETYFEKAQEFRNSFKKVFFFGTGGSSLGGEALCALDSGDNKTDLSFIANIDPFSFEKQLKEVDISHLGFVFISKSGNTPEVLAQFLSIINLFNDQQKKQLLQKNILIITEDKDNLLRRMANHFSISTLSHPDQIGGRYSVFSIVGAFPALIKGIDLKLFHKGARDCLDDFLEIRENNLLNHPIITGAFLSSYFYQTKKLPISVIIPYSDYLEPFSRWYCQLWAESIGKEEMGSTPVRALGTIDQHSQLQLYLDGPRDKFFTLILRKCHDQGMKLSSDDFFDEGLGYLSKKTMGDLMEAEQTATYHTLVHNGCPTRLFYLNDIDETALGSLMMHFIIETILTAKLWNINPFDQPAVEQGKKLTKDYLLNNNTDLNIL